MLMYTQKKMNKKQQDIYIKDGVHFNVYLVFIESKNSNKRYITIGIIYKIVYNINVGGCNGFDDFLKVQIASSGWLLWPLKKSRF